MTQSNFRSPMIQWSSLTVYNTGISLLLSTSVWVLFKSPDRTSRDKTNGLTFLSTDGVAKEGRPKFNPRPGRGLNPGPHGWQSEILPTVPTSHTLVMITIIPRATKRRQICKDSSYITFLSCDALRHDNVGYRSVCRNLR